MAGGGRGMVEVKLNIRGMGATCAIVDIIGRRKSSMEDYTHRLGITPGGQRRIEVTGFSLI